MKSFTVLDVAQRSEAWFQARAGRLTGSAAKAMLATVKSGEAAGRRDLRVRLMLERLTGQPQENGYVNAEMMRGIDCEPLALAAYESLTGEIVQTTGFLRHDALMVGASLDGHLGDFETIVSLKCPKSATHLEYLKAGRFPIEHEPQMLHELWLTGAQHYELLSWDDRFPPDLRVFHVTVKRASVETAIEQYEKAALAFLVEVDAELEAVQKLRGKVAA